MGRSLLNNSRQVQLTFAVALALTFALAVSQTAFAAGQIAALEGKYDLTLQPISAATLKQALLNSSDDPIMVYQLVLRARTQKEPEIVYSTLKTLRHYQPNNAVVLAGYCLAFNVYEGKYSGPDAIVHSFSGEEEEDYSQTLSRAHQLNPKLWLVYAVEGHNSTGSPAQDLRCLALYKEAEKLAPALSYTHTLLGNAYATYYTPYHSFDKAAAEYSKALLYEPLSAEAAFGLFDIYDIRLPNVARAKLAKAKLQSLLPPGFHLKEQAAQRLAKY